MFEKYSEMSAEEQAHVKALHKTIRSDRSFGERYRILAWGFVRGFKYRRIERSHRLQRLADDAWCPEGPEGLAYGLLRLPEGKFFEHNMPDGVKLAKLLAKHIPEYASEIDGWRLRGDSTILAWLADPSGAIPVPVRAPKEAA